MTGERLSDEEQLVMVRSGIRACRALLATLLRIEEELMRRVGQ